MTTATTNGDGRDIMLLSLLDACQDGLLMPTDAYPPVAVVTLDGEIDVATAPYVRELLRALVAVGTEQIILDCEDLLFLDAAGVSAIVAAVSVLGDGNVTVRAPKAHIRRVLDICQVSEHVTYEG